MADAYFYDGVDEEVAGSLHFVAVTKSDSVALALGRPKGLYIGGAGDVTLKGTDDAAAVTFTALPVGAFCPLRPMYVMATGTTATNIVALY
jgi:hypothetical protein